MIFSESTQLVLRRRYLLKDEAGNPAESPDAMFRRVASFVAGAEDAKKARPAASAGGTGLKRASKDGDEPLFTGEEAVGVAGGPARSRGKAIPSDRYKLLAREAAAIIEARKRGEAQAAEEAEEQTPLLTEEPES